jgi:hypothetical protein
MDLKQQLKAAVTEALISKALQDPWAHALMSTEISNLSSTIASLKGDFALLANDLWDFDELNFFYGQSIDVLLHKEWRNLEAVRSSRYFRDTACAHAADNAGGHEPFWL